jgi:hypothetical protein
VVALLRVITVLVSVPLVFVVVRVEVVLVGVGVVAEGGGTCVHRRCVPFSYHDEFGDNVSGEFRTGRPGLPVTVKHSEECLVGLAVKIGVYALGVLRWFMETLGVIATLRAHGPPNSDAVATNDPICSQKRELTKGRWNRWGMRSEGNDKHGRPPGDGRGGGGFLILRSPTGVVRGLYKRRLTLCTARRGQSLLVFPRCEGPFGADIRRVSNRPHLLEVRWWSRQVWVSRGIFGPTAAHHRQSMLQISRFN